MKYQFGNNTGLRFSPGRFYAKMLDAAKSYGFNGLVVRGHERDSYENIPDFHIIHFFDEVSCKEMASCLQAYVSGQQGYFALEKSLPEIPSEFKKCVFETLAKILTPSCVQLEMGNPDAIIDLYRRHELPRDFLEFQNGILKKAIEARRMELVDGSWLHCGEKFEPFVDFDASVSSKEEAHFLDFYLIWLAMHFFKQGAVWLREEGENWHLDLSDWNLSDFVLPEVEILNPSETEGQSDEVL